MTTAPPELPDKAELERHQLYLANTKLEIETRKLEREARPEKWWARLAKQAIATGGILTVAATLFGLWDSYNKTINDRERARDVEQRTRFEDAIKHLESSTTISKLIGVSVLSGYLDSNSRDLHRQILFTLASLMSTEKDVQVQVAVTDLMSAIPVEGPIARKDWVYFQENLVSQSRALVAKADLARRRALQAAYMLTDEERRPGTLTDEERAARALGRLIAINMQKGAAPHLTNYRGIYCAGCDFRGVAFPRGVDFTGAILDGANFGRARLVAARFDDAELNHTTFIEADLKQASFGGSFYLDRVARALAVNARVSIGMPNFSCANLEGADFSGQALFALQFAKRVWRRDLIEEGKTAPAWYRTIPRSRRPDQGDSGSDSVEFSPVRILPPTFFKANLKNSQLRGTRMFGIAKPDNLPDFTSIALLIDLSDLWFFQVDVDELQINPGTDPNGAGADDNPSDDYLRRIRATFFGAELDQASLPPNLAEYLSKSKPTQEDYDSEFGSIDCTPRRD